MLQLSDAYNRVEARMEGRRWITAARIPPDLPAVLCFMLLSLVAVTWFRGSYYITAGDFNWPLDRLKQLQEVVYAWNASFGTGYPNPRQVGALPFLTLAGLTQILGMPGPAFEQMMFAIWFGGSGLTMYYLARVLGLSRVAALGSGLFYACNVFGLLAVWYITHGVLMPFYAFLPLHLGLFIWGYRNRRGWRYAFLANLLLLFSTMHLTLSNPVFPALMWGMAATWVAYDVVTGQIDSRMLRSVVQFGACWALMNVFWIAPFVLNFGQQYAGAANTGLNITDEQTLRLASVQVTDALRLTGLWSLHSGVGSDAYYPWAAQTTSLWYVAISYIPTILMAMALLRAPSRYRVALICGLLLMVGVYLVSLPFVPGGNLIIAFMHVHAAFLLRAVRGGYLKFGFVLPVGAAILVGLGLEVLGHAVRRILGAVGALACVSVVAVLIFGVLVFPYWTGDVVSVAGRQYWPSWRVRLPPAYLRLDAVMQQGEWPSSRAFSIPLVTSYYVDYTWGRAADGTLQGYEGSDILSQLSTTPVIYSTIYEFGVLDALAKDIASFPTVDTLNRVFGLLNVRFVVLHQDINPFSQSQIAMSDATMHWLHVVLHKYLLNYNLFSLYTVPPRYVLPIVYSPRFLVDSRTTPADFMRVLHNGNLASLGVAAYAPLTAQPTPRDANWQDSINRAQAALKMLGQTLRWHQHEVMPIASPTHLTFRRVNPTEYDVTVQGAQGRPFVLVLGERYDPNWRVYIVPSGGTVSCDGRHVAVSLAAPVSQCMNGTSFVSRQQLADTFRQPIPAVQHFVANGSANGWVIKPFQAHGQSSFTIVLDYTPQRQVLLSLAITLISAVLAITVGVLVLRSLLCRRSTQQRC